MTPKAHQRGATLLVAMIFLILMSLFAISAFKSSTGNLRIIGNMQSRQEAIAVGQKAIEDTISSSVFTSNPAAVAATPVAVDIDGDGTVDYTATLNPQPHCYRTKAIKSSDLNPAIPADLACMTSSVVQQGGLDIPDAAADAGNSLCANSEWNVGAQVLDQRSGAKVVVNQGIAVRVLETDAANACL
jgi:hypothetical protein